VADTPPQGGGEEGAGVARVSARVVDGVGSLEEFLQRVRRRIGELGLARVKDGRAYY
jgi:hypothetical protein